MYLSLVLVFGLLAQLIAVPLGGLAAYAMTQYLAHLINFDLTGFRLPPQALALEVGVGLLVPLLAALFPVLSGARISVYAAITSYGLGRGRFGRGWFDRLLLGRRTPTHSLALSGGGLGRGLGVPSSVGSRRSSLTLSRPMRISLRNTFRRKGRLALTLSTLTLGGAIFVAVLTVHASLLKTLDEALTYWNYEIEVSFAHTHRVDEIEREALSVPGVAAAESWNGNTARRQRPDGHEGPNLYILGVPADTTMIQPVLLAGRWLRADDTNALVVNTEVLDEESDIQVGDEIVLKMEGREGTWRVVGVVQGILTGRIAYANQPYFARAVRFVGRAGGVQVAAAPPGDTSKEDAAFQLELGNRLKEHFDERGMRVRAANTTAALRENINTSSTSSSSSWPSWRCSSHWWVVWG